MELHIGDKIRELRRQHKLTQEQLADRIGVSFQAVSKWENHIALPDITLVPVIAGLFGVTTDQLLSYDLQERQKAVEAICDQAYPFRENDPAKAREILEAGLERFPDNPILLNNLLYVLTDPDESIRTVNHLLDITGEADIRYDALRFLAYAYNAKGDSAGAAAVLEQIPEIYFTKLSELAFVLDGPAKREAADKQKWISCEMLLQMMWKLAECHEADRNIPAAVEETKKALAIIDIMEQPCFANYGEFFRKNLARWEENR